MIFPPNTIVIAATISMTTIGILHYLYYSCFRRNNYRIIWYIVNNNCISPYTHVVTDFDSTKNNCACSDVNVIPNFRTSFSNHSKCYIMMHPKIFTNLIGI